MDSLNPLLIPKTLGRFLKLGWSWPVQGQNKAGGRDWAGEGRLWLAVGGPADMLWPRFSYSSGADTRSALGRLALPLVQGHKHALLPGKFQPPISCARYGGGLLALPFQDSLGLRPESPQPERSNSLEAFCHKEAVLAVYRIRRPSWEMWAIPAPGLKGLVIPFPSSLIYKFDTDRNLSWSH